MPAAGEGRSAVLGLVLLQARLQLGPEVADETLDGPGEGFAQSCGGEIRQFTHSSLQYVGY